MLRLLHALSVAFAMLALLDPLAGEAASPFDLTLRDAVSGQRVAATVRVGLAGGGTVERMADERGTLRLDLPPGDHRLEASCRGHRPLGWRLHVGPQGALPVTAWLDPEQAPAELAPAAVRAMIPADFALLYGFVHDAVTGQPLAGALVSLERRGWGDVTDENGFFRTFYPLEPFDPDSLPPEDALLVEANGYRTLAQEGVFLVPGATMLLLDPSPGDGLDSLSPNHKMLLLGRPSQLEPDPTAAVSPAGESGSRALLPLTPPASIRVGSSCSPCTVCPTVNAMSLETYVKRGLNDEWIASWGGHSLRAGAVAYRSYGAWYVANPLDPSYDICDNTCCQVNDADTSTSTDAAGTATAGFMLERSGAVFRSEYSAENNALLGASSCSNSDLSCGDGWAGSPAAYWPCLSDSLCTGHACFGHGRGMCQWGTSRWSDSGSAWTWMVDHYYNAGGAGSDYRTAYMTTPLWVDSVEPRPPIVLPGWTFRIRVAATNTAALAHDRVMIGASLYSSATGYLSDPPHDALVTLEPGANERWRAFSVPVIPDGAYDLLVSLYYDVNGDGAITSADKNLVLVREDGAVTVSSAGLIFADGFETGDTSAWVGEER